MNITIEIGGPLAEAINNLASALDRHTDAGAAMQRDALQFAAINTAGTPTEKASTSTKARTKKEVAPEPNPTSGPAISQTAPATKAATAENVVGDTSTSSSQAPEAPSLKDLQTEILRIAREKGHDAAAALLAQFGARKVSEVKPEDGARLLAAAKEI